MDIIVSQGAGGDRRNFSGWSIGETSSNNQSNRGNQMTHGEPMMERWITTSSSANHGSGQPFPWRMWVEGVPTTVDQRNFSGVNIGGLAFNQNNPGTQMRHAEPMTGSGMSSANPGARQLPGFMWDEDNRDELAKVLQHGYALQLRVKLKLSRFLLKMILAHLTKGKPQKNIR